MKITPQGGPGAVPSNAVKTEISAPGAVSELAKANRARAIAAWNTAKAAQGAPQAPNTIQEGTGVQNASNVSPEEMVGLRPQSAPPAEITQESGQTPPTEATSPPPAKVEEPLSPQYAVLARQAKALRQAQQNLKAERAAFKAEQDASRAAPPVQAATTAAVDDALSTIPRDRLVNDPVGVFEELGLSAEELANRILNHRAVDPATANYMSKLEAKIAKLEAAQDDSKKAFETSQSDSYEQAVVAIRNEAEDLVDTDPDFATIKEMGQSEEIVNLIKDVHAKGLEGKYRKGTLLTVEAAARLVEDELVNQWVEKHEKLSRLEKIQKRLKPATQVGQQASALGTQQQQSAATNQNTTRTLTNSMGSSGKMSARDRAIAVFNGTIKTG